MATALDRLRYAAGQGARMAWFAGHYVAARRLGRPFDRPDEVPFRPRAPWPTPAEMWADIRALLEADWARIDAGIYAMPRRFVSPAALTRSRAFLADVSRIDARRLAHGHSEVLTDARRARFPRYYLQNFHYQTGGWLSGESARLYDFQVETIFAGTADAMRRQALVPIAAHLQGRDQRGLHLLDIACGTGRFLAEVKHNWPRLNVTALDLSPDYLARARARLAPWRGVQVVEAQAEAMPLPEASQDVVTAIYLFHELPPRVRADVAAEVARVLKPGGLFVLLDSIQYGDAPHLDALIEAFPKGLHEPYYEGYARLDLDALFAPAGLVRVDESRGFLTKMVAYRRG